MYIANPIYDVVFKYLMEDNSLAKLIISTIIKEEILELTLRPQEFISDAERFAVNPTQSLSKRIGKNEFRRHFSQ